MYLGGKRVKGKSLKTGLTDLGSKLNDDELAELVRRLKNGESVENKILRGHIRLILQVSGRYVSYFPNKEDDIVGVALLAATEGVKKARKDMQEPNNISGWIVRSVHYGISHFLKTDDTIQLPRWIKEKGGYKWLPKVVTLDDIDYDKYQQTSKSPYDQVHEIISKTSLSELEHEIIHKVLAGWKITEIAEDMGVSHQYISSNYQKTLAKLKEMG